MSKLPSRSTYVLIIFIGSGGAIGSLLRYGMAQLFSTDAFPYGTLIANILGCFVLAFLTNYAFIKKNVPNDIKLAINTGIIGSFTTFSTFTVETFTLLTDHLLVGIMYSTLSIVVGLLACFIGYLLANKKSPNKEVIE